MATVCAALVVDSLPPIDLLAVERKEMYASTKERERMSARNQEVPTLNEEIRAARQSKWQERWNEETTGRRTHRLIPDVLPWVSRAHGEVNYY